MTDRNRESAIGPDKGPRQFKQQDQFEEGALPLGDTAITETAKGAADLIDLRSESTSAKKAAAALTPEATAARRGSHLVITEHTMVDALNSQMYLERSAERRRAIAAEAERLTTKDYVFYLRCKKHRHQGIHFLINPVGKMIQPREWLATYRAADQPWQFPIWCQECLGLGQHEELHYTVVDFNAGTFRPHERHLWKVPRDVEAFMEEGETRALHLPMAASNMDLMQHEAALEARRRARMATGGVSHA